jgi:uncharacterized membrane protein
VTAAHRPDEARPTFERSLGRLLIGLTYVAVGLLAIGVALMAVHGISPLGGGPRFDASRLLADVAALAPAGFLWLGLLAIIAAPISRVAAAAIGYARDGDRAMVGIAVAILVVIAASVASAIIAS